MCGLTKHKVKMDRDSDATEIEDESLHLYFSGEDSPSLLSGTPKVSFCFCFVFSFLFQTFKNSVLNINSLFTVLIVTLVLKPTLSKLSL